MGWLAGARAVRGGLLVPGRPADGAAAIRLGADHVELTMPDERMLVLTWEEPWAIGPWAQPAGGVAVVGVDDRRPEAKELHDALLPSVVIRALLDTEHQGIPLDRGSSLGTGPAADRETFEQLCIVLRMRPAIRERLTDSERTFRLAEDLARDAVAVVHPSSGLRRTTLEIETAMRLCGFEHRWGGRPLPGEVTRPLEDAVSLVLTRVRANPWAQDLHIDAAQVEGLLRKRYYDVAPWPFGALTIE